MIVILKDKVFYFVYEFFFDNEMEILCDKEMMGSLILYLVVFYL